MKFREYSDGWNRRLQNTYLERKKEKQLVNRVITLQNTKKSRFWYKNEFNVRFWSKIIRHLAFLALRPFINCRLNIGFESFEDLYKCKVCKCKVKYTTWITRYIKRVTNTN